MSTNGAHNHQSTPHFQWSTWARYPITILLVIAVTAGLLALSRHLPLLHYPIYYVVLLLAVAYWFGTWPAILTFVAELLALDYVLSRPKYVFHILPSNPDDWAQYLSFLTGSIAVGVVMMSIYRSRRRNETLTESLRESKERFQSLVEATSDWIWEVDARGAYTYASPRVKDLLGYEPSEVVGRTPLDLMPHEEAEQLAPVMQRHWERAEPFVNLDNMNLHKDGHLVLLETSGLPVFDENGNLAGYRGIDRDITERKSAEQALRESEYRYATAQRAANIGSWDWNIITGGLIWSDQIEPMFGFAPGQFNRTYEAFLDRVHPDDRQSVIDSVNAALEGRKDYAIEHRIMWPDGTVRWVSENGEVHRDEGGVPIRMFGIVQDITKRKQAEEALYEASQRLRFHVENSPLAVVEFDPEFRIIRWTKGAEKMFGWSAEEVLGKSALEMKWIYEEDRDAVTALNTGLIDQRTARTINKNRNYRKDESLIYCVWYSSNLVDPSGEVVSILALVLDVTQETSLRQKLESQIKLLQQALVPSAPATLDGYTAAAVYLPGFSGQEIGGDFYDTFQTEDGKLGFVIGDVCGKGIEAASLAAASRSTIRAFAYELSSAAESLTHTNAVLSAQQTDPGRFVTVFAIVIDPEKGRINYASAGHPPGAIRRANGLVEFMKIDNPPIGVSEKWDFTSAEDQLDPGDKILLYTDGILEARRGLEFFDIDGISRTLFEHGDECPAELANSMLQAAKDWSGGELRDDVAIIVIERRA